MESGNEGINQDVLKDKPECISETMWKRFCNVEDKIKTLRENDRLR